jgi:predicted RNase H-like HicB family nuclease
MQEVINLHIKIRLQVDEDGVFVATCPSLPGCISQGKTRREALKNIREAIKLHLDSLAEDGIPLRNDLKYEEAIIRVGV